MRPRRLATAVQQPALRGVAAGVTSLVIDEDYEYCSASSSSSSDSDSEDSGIIDEIDMFIGRDDYSDDDSDANADKDNNPPPKTKNCKPPFAPDNVLVPWAELWSSYKQFPCPTCCKEETWDGSLTLNAEAHPHGVISDIVIRCERCNHTVLVSPGYCRHSKLGPRTTAREGNNLPAKKYNRRVDPQEYSTNPKDSKFMKYSINYSIVILMQLLGIGPDGLAMIFAFLGISSGKGSYSKWKKIQDVVGEAEETLCEQECKANIELELRLTREVAMAKWEAWKQQEGRDSTEDEGVDKMEALLRVQPTSDGVSAARIGIGVATDGAWQKRAIGLGGGNSKSGMNYCVGVQSKRIINLGCYSKQCTSCTWWRKRYPLLETPLHRCPQNFDPNASSKRMEPDATVQHKVDIELPNNGVYVATLLTDDDSTVRANTRYGYRALADRDYPGWSRRKGDTNWPYKINAATGKPVYFPDYGKLPLQCYPISKFLSDIGHRVKCIAKAIFNLKSKSMKLADGLLAKGECLKLKKSAGYYFKQEANQALPFDDFCSRAHCIYLHHFGNHSVCNVSWCKVLKSQRNANPIALTEDYKSRFRSKEINNKLFKLVVKAFTPYLETEAMRQVYH
jgi:hypothetical protein